MWYVRKRVVPDKFEIVDTETGNSKILSVDTVCSVKVGALSAVKGIVWRPSYRAWEIRPYQRGECVTPLQLKLKMLKHVEVVTDSGVVTDIRFEGDKITDAVPIRLSDFGTELADSIIAQHRSYDDTKISLILDDKLELSAKTFICDCDMEYELELNLCELSDEKALLAYLGMMHNIMNALGGCHIVDKPNRYSAMVKRAHSIIDSGHFNAY